MLRWSVAAILVLAFCSSAAAQGLSGRANLNYSSTEQTEDGERISTVDTFNQNYFLSLGKQVTPMLSYQFHMRTNIVDTESTDSVGMTDLSYRRAVEPSLDIFLRNPVYGLDAGYRVRERWEAAHLSDKSRETTEYYYSRLSITPLGLPTLSLQVDRQKDFDHLPVRETDITSTRYSGSSFYQYSGRGVDTSYNITYSRDRSETPQSLTYKSIDDALNGIFRLGYTGSFRGGKVGLSTLYQGNYVWNKKQTFVPVTGDVLFERSILEGLHATGTLIQPDVDSLASEPALADGDTSTAIATINIGTQRYHNIGLRLLTTAKPVDRVYVYVDQNVSSDANLFNPTNWRAYKSNTNIPGTIWTQITILSVSISEFDALNNIYRYELALSGSHSATYFKVVNMDTVNVLGLTDVFVTEVEAYGTDNVPATGRITDDNTFFTQGLTLNARLNAASNLDLLFDYYLNRADHNPASTLDSIGGVLLNVFSNSLDKEGDLRSTVTRSFGPTARWMTHRLLTTTLRLQRSDVFDNSDTIDLSSNTYSLSFNSAPLPTLDANLSLIRTDSSSFSEKTTTSNSYLLSIGARLYRDVNMLTDLGYTQSEFSATGTGTTTRYIRGTIDALLTERLFANLSYSFDWLTSGGTSSDIREGSTIISYRPGRFINLSGNFKVSDADGDTTTIEGGSVDWLFLPTVRLNTSYQHTRAEPGPVTSDSLSSSCRWTITRFMDVQVTYSFTRRKEEVESEGHLIAVNLSGRF